LKKNRKWLWLILALLILGLGGYIFLRWWNSDIVAIKTGVIARAGIESIISASGTVNAPVYELGTKLGGKIADLKVNEGDTVSRGQLLAEFDNYEQSRNDFERTKSLYQDGAASRQAFDAAKSIFELSRIVAPNDGIVAKINYRVGETVVPASPAIVVVNYEQSWVEVQVDEIDISGVKIGDRVKITSDVYPDKIYIGEIYWIAPIAELRRVGGRIKIDEESYVFLCKIKFIGRHDELKVNMSVNVDIVTQKKEQALLVPREALVSKDDSLTVFVVKKNRVYQTKIQTGLRSYASVEATAGVVEGEKVAISNLPKLKDKGRVKVE